MRRLLACTLLCATCCGPAAADVFPRVVHGAAASAQPLAAALIGEPIEVAGELLQIELGPDLTLSLGAGAKLAILRPPGAAQGLVVVVLAEPVLAAHTRLDRIATLGIGSHLLSSGGDAAGDWALRLSAADGRAMPGLSARGFQLGDWVMVRQQAYLDSLRIDVLPLNHAIAGFIRRLLPGGGK